MKPGSHRLVDRLARLEARGRECAQGRAVPRLVAADDLVLAGRAGQLMVLPRQLDRRLDDLGPAALKLDRRQVPRRQLGEQVGQLHGLRVGAVHRRRKRQDVELLLDRVDHPAVVVSHRDDVDARDRVEIALAMHVPVVHAVGACHHDRLLRELGHLVAHEDLAEERLLGRLGLFDQVGNVDDIVISGVPRKGRSPFDILSSLGLPRGLDPIPHRVATTDRSITIAILRGHRGIQPRDPNEVVDLDPFRDVCWPPARGPCVIAGTPANALKLLPSSTNGLGPVGNGVPPRVA